MDPCFSFLFAGAETPSGTVQSSKLEDKHPNADKGSEDENNRSSESNLEVWQVEQERVDIDDLCSHVSSVSYQSFYDYPYDTDEPPQWTANNLPVTS